MLDPKVKPKRYKHNYTSELELKTLLIRIKNKRGEIGDARNNVRINKYIKLFNLINAKKYENPQKRNKTKAKLKAKAIELSERTQIDTPSYEQFGSILLLMIKNILKKPQFSGYTYKDDFYSDAIHKILKYLGNFNHKLISEITGQPVNSFAYISQIMHNSILFIINTKKKENDRNKQQVSMEYVSHQLSLKNNTTFNVSAFDAEQELDVVTETIILKKVKTNLVDELVKIQEDAEKFQRIDLIYPVNYLITFEEYDLLKPLLKGNINIMRTQAA